MKSGKTWKNRGIVFWLENFSHAFFLPLQSWYICEIISMVDQNFGGKCEKDRGFFDKLIWKSWKSLGIFLKIDLRALAILHAV